MKTATDSVSSSPETERADPGTPAPGETSTFSVESGAPACPRWGRRASVSSGIFPDEGDNLQPRVPLRPACHHVERQLPSTLTEHIWPKTAFDLEPWSEVRAEVRCGRPRQ